MDYWCLTYISFILVFANLSCQNEQALAQRPYHSFESPISSIENDSIYLEDGEKIGLEGLNSGKKSLLIIIKHVETDTIGLDPGLSRSGERRAQKLGSLLQNTSVNHYYTTHFRRTYLTLLPLREKRPGDISRYEPEDQKLFADQLLAKKGQTSLVVGHEDTLPELLDLIWEGKEVHMSSSEYDDFIIAETGANGIVSLYKFKY